ncbi:MAG TPA: hypothetical protein VM238_22880 [Phycisphaerae bacterium]|nr:hypothetical protein [Phycisphaerae bacterium]
MPYIDWQTVWSDFNDWYETFTKAVEPDWEEQKRKIEELVRQNMIG